MSVAWKTRHPPFLESPPKQMKLKRGGQAFHFYSPAYSKGPLLPGAIAPTRTNIDLRIASVTPGVLRGVQHSATQNTLDFHLREQPNARTRGHTVRSICTHLHSTNIIVGDSMFPYSDSTAHESKVCSSSVKPRPFSASSMIPRPPGWTHHISTNFEEGGEEGANRRQRTWGLGSNRQNFHLV